MNRKGTMSGEDNVFAEFQALIKDKIENEKQEGINLFELQSILYSIENTLEKSLFLREKFWETTFYKKLDTILRKFLSAFIIRSFKNDILYHSFLLFSNYLLFLSRESTNVKSKKEIFKNFQIFLPSVIFSLNIDPHLEFEVNIPENYFSINDFERSLGEKLKLKKVRNNKIISFNHNIFKVFCDNYIVQEIKWDNKNLEFIILDTYHYLNIDLKYETGKKQIEFPESFAVSFLNIITALKSIDNLILEINEISKGSIWVSMRLWMKDFFSKEEAKELLKKGKEAVINEYVDKKITEHKKLNEEISKIDIEKKLLKSQLDEKLTQEQIQKNIEYDLELKKLEIERKKLEVYDLKMKLVKDSYELMKNGIVSAKQLEFFVNENLFVRKDGESIGGPDLDIDDIT